MYIESKPVKNMDEVYRTYIESMQKVYRKYTESTTESTQKEYRNRKYVGSI